MIESTKKIMQAMKFVAMATLEKKKHHLHRLTNYNIPLENLFHQIGTSQSLRAINPYFKQHHGVTKELVLFVTGDKGLCGAFNQTILKAVTHYYESSIRSGNQIEWLPIGKKGRDFIQKKAWPIVEKYTDILQQTSYVCVRQCSAFLITDFLNGTYQKITILTQPRVAADSPIFQTWLPMEKIDISQKTIAHDHSIYEPNKKAIITYILPQVLTCSLYESILRTQISEQKARMLAMSQATDNADKLFKEQKLKYNRLRQASITQGIMEAASGFST